MLKFLLDKKEVYDIEEIDPLYRFDRKLREISHPHFLGCEIVDTPYIDMDIFQICNINIKVRFDPSTKNQVRYIKENLCNYYCNKIIEYANELILDSDITRIWISILYQDTLLEERQYTLGENE